MGRHSTKILAEAPLLATHVDIITPPQSPPSKKRKRDAIQAAEIEVDINAPEPPSKKALRKSKKEGKNSSSGAVADARAEKAQTGDHAPNEDVDALASNPKRSEHSIWIGNLSWSTTKTELREFFSKNMSDDAESITRLHLPSPSQSTLMKCQQKIKPQNKGFAYVDFASETALKEALGLSEHLFSGRKVLIKDAKNFEGRPEKNFDDKDKEAGASSGKPPSVRIFVGNLQFETTKEEIREHFGKCGVVGDVFLTTFEDSGKCKGYGWVTFETVEAAENAVRGWVEIAPDAEEEEEEGVNSGENVRDELNDVNEARRSQVGDQRKAKKKPKMRKWWVNRLQGRQLKIEFAEGKDVRYKKRYGKGAVVAPGRSGEADGGAERSTTMPRTDLRSSKTDEKHSRVPNMRRKQSESRVDARSIKPGAALAAAPRLTGGIVESTGKKTTFES